MAGQSANPFEITQQEKRVHVVMLLGQRPVEMPDGPITIRGDALGTAPDSGRFSLLGRFLCLLLCLAGDEACLGHAGSISLFVNPANNQLYVLETFEVPQMRKFLDAEISVDGPGFLVNFPANHVLPGAELDVDVIQDLMFWDGVGLAKASTTFRFMAPQFDNQGMLNETPVPEYLVTSNSGKLTGMDWGTYNGAQFWEAHGLNFLEPLAAPAGIYGVGVRVKSPAHATSDPFIIPYVYDPLDELDAAAEATGVARLRSATAAHAIADVNDDGHVDIVDADLIVADIAAMTNTPTFDLSGDGVVTIKDLTAWRREAGAATLRLGGNYLDGDANLDGVVDVSDFNLWSAHKFTGVAAWSAGDFNADGFVDVTDFNIWNTNKFNSSDPLPSAVPEPAGIFGSLLGLFFYWTQMTRHGISKEKGCHQ